MRFEYYCGGSILIKRGSRDAAFFLCPYFPASNIYNKLSSKTSKVQNSFIISLL